MKSKIRIALLLLGIIIVAESCKVRQVERINPSEQTDLSGRWNDTDSRLVAEEMVNDALNRPWRTRFETKYSKVPVVVVALVDNKSHEHIATETFIKDMERAFVNSGLVRLVQAGEKREDLREERADQQQYASKETAKAWGKELGADYILQGDLNSIVDSYQNRKAVTYQVNMELTDLETNEIVWIGDKKIKKFITN